MEIQDGWQTIHDDGLHAIQQKSRAVPSKFHAFEWSILVRQHMGLPLLIDGSVDEEHDTHDRRRSHQLHRYRIHQQLRLSLEKGWDGDLYGAGLDLTTNRVDREIIILPSANGTDGGQPEKEPDKPRVVVVT